MPWRKTIPSTSLRRAPSAMRIPNLARSLTHRVRKHSVDADGCKSQGQQGKQREQPGLKAPLRPHIPQLLLQRGGFDARNGSDGAGQLVETGTK